MRFSAKPSRKRFSLDYFQYAWRIIQLALDIWYVCTWMHVCTYINQVRAFNILSFLFFLFFILIFFLFQADHRGIEKNEWVKWQLGSEKKIKKEWNMLTMNCIQYVLCRLKYLFRLSIFFCFKNLLLFFLVLFSFATQNRLIQLPHMGFEKVYFRLSQLLDTVLI